METIILKYHLLRICWERSVAFIYSYSSLICSQVTHENIHEKKCWTHEIPRRKTLDPQNNNKKKFQTQQGTMARWHETHEMRNDTRPTEFRTLIMR